VTAGDVAETKAWLARLTAGVVLNVAGPRESNCPGTYSRTADLLLAVLTQPPDLDG
jgi:hypothetical protein